MGGRTTTKRRQSNGIGSLMLSFVTFILGYLVASVFDISSLSHWMTSRISTQATSSHPSYSRVQTAEIPKPKFEFYTLLTKDQSVEPTVAATNTKPAAAAAAVAPQLVAKPEPAINANSAVVVANTASKAEAAPLDLTVTQKLPLHEPLVATAQPQSQPQLKAIPIIDKGRYIIQVGSFKNQHEAEKMRAVLVMRGFSPVITSTTQQQVTWYRVLIGPFPSLTDAQRVHREFAVRDRITGMIRKLDV